VTARSVPVLRSWVAGETDTGAYMQTNIKIAGDFMLQHPMVAARQTTGQTLTTANTWYPITLDVEDIDDDGSNNSRFTVPAGLGGWYDVMGKVAMVPAAAGTILYCGLTVNTVFINDSYSAESISAATGYLTADVADMVYLNPGDYLEMRAQCTAAGKSLSSASAVMPYLKMIWAHR
jgi:hypothetical protein